MLASDLILDVAEDSLANLGYTLKPPLSALMKRAHENEGYTKPWTRSR